MAEILLHTREDVQLVRAALSAAQSIEDAEKKLAESTKAFREASQKIIDKTGFELWHTDADGGEYFWRKEKRESILYASRSDALKALLDEAIEWK